MTQRRSLRRQRGYEFVEHHSNRILTILLASALGASLLAIGTVHVPVLMVLAPLALLAGAVALAVEPNPARRVPGPAWVLLALAGWSLLQSLPLPFGWLAHLSPAAAQVWRDAWHVLGTTPHAASLSVDPHASRVEALKWLTYAATFVAAARLAREKGGKLGAALLLSSAVLGVIASLGHGLAGAETWFGLYRPVYAHPAWALTPLLNPNNFAGYLNLALFSGLGLVMTARPPAPRWLIGLAVATLGAMVVLTGSRGGVLAMLVGLAISAVALGIQSRRRTRTGAPRLPVYGRLLVVAAAIGTLVTLGSTPLVWQQLREESLEKFAILSWTQPLLNDFPLFGVGRGAYESVSSAYRTSTGNVVFNHAENFLVDWCAEWGWPVALAAVLALAYTLRPRRLGWLRHPVPTAAMVGVAALLLQNLVDLALEIPSVALGTAFLLGSIYGGTLFSRERAQRNLAQVEADAPRVRRRRRLLEAGALGLVSLLLIGSIGVDGATDLTAERERLKVRFDEADDPVELRQFRADLSQVMAQHPADGYPPLLGALVARRLKESPFGWLNQVLRRDPKNGRARLVLADVLRDYGRAGQYRLALRDAALIAPELSELVAERAMRTLGDHELETLVPPGKIGCGLLNSLSWRLHATPNKKPLGDRFLAMSLERDPNSAFARRLAHQRLLARLADPADACSSEERPACEAKLHEQQQALVRLEPDALETVIAQALTKRHHKDLRGAFDYLLEHCPEFPGDARCTQQMVALAYEQPDRSRQDESASLHLANACIEPASCAGAAEWLAALAANRTDWLTALMRQERVVQEAPNAKRWLALVNFSLRASRPVRARKALEEARRQGATPAALAPFEQQLKSISNDELIRSLQPRP